MKGPVEPVHRSVPETIQEVIELTGFLCFLFRSTPTEDVNSLKMASFSLSFSSLFFSDCFKWDFLGGVSLSLNGE